MQLGYESLNKREPDFLFTQKQYAGMSVFETVDRKIIEYTDECLFFQWRFCQNATFIDRYDFEVVTVTIIHHYKKYNTYQVGTTGTNQLSHSINMGTTHFGDHQILNRIPFGYFDRMFLPSHQTWNISSLFSLSNF